ncbi:MAG TPA: WD40 repeat domain-containing protein [Pyrinomonadaceae bacterium]|nr:WD40 repeat domain-containing protein [Pyrinomonadaceae bacterium]
MRHNTPRLATALLAILSLAAYADAQAPRGDADATPATSKSLLKQDATTPNSQGWSLKFTLSGHEGAVYSAAFFPDGTKLITAGDDGVARLWNLRTGTLLGTLAASDETVTGVTVSFDGRFIATCADDDNAPVVKIWDARTLRLIRTLKGHSEGLYELAFSPRGYLLASGGRDKTIMLWNAATGRLLSTLEGHTDSVTSLAFTNDGARLASASAADDKTVRLWDVRTRKLLRTFAGHDDWVTSVAFSPGGNVLASASRDKNIILWDATTGAKRLTLPQPNLVYELAFSPDGTTLAEVGARHEVLLHDATTGDLLGMLEGYTGEISEVKFSSDGMLLVATSYDATVKVWQQRRTKPETNGRVPRGRRRR